jgi:DNA-binding CsgD family transcriptional regulator
VCGITLIAGDDLATHELAADLVSAARAQGASGYLPTLLFFLAEAELFHGQHREAIADATESLRIAQDTGQRHWVRQTQEFLGYIAAVEGDTERCHSLTEGALPGGGADSRVAPGAWALWARGMLDLGHGRVQDALTWLLSMVTGAQSHHVSATRAIPDLVEAAVRVGEPEQATTHLARFERWADFTRQPWAAALVQRCHALLAADDEAEARYAAALREHAAQDRPLERARTILLYGEWLRRARRRSEARPQLAAALQIFERLGAEPWARRARAELDAAGAPAPTAHQPSSVAALTPQELQVVRLAARGLSNRDIAAQLFLSPRTVGYHLYKAYPKLGIASRAELAAALRYD